MRLWKFGKKSNDNNEIVIEVDSDPLENYDEIRKKSEEPVELAPFIKDFCFPKNIEEMQFTEKEIQKIGDTCFYDIFWGLERYYEKKYKVFCDNFYYNKGGFRQDFYGVFFGFKTTYHLSAPNAFIYYNNKLVTRILPSNIRDGKWKKCDNIKPLGNYAIYSMLYLIDHVDQIEKNEIAKIHNDVRQLICKD
jgi:hypothetical protein